MGQDVSDIVRLNNASYLYLLQPAHGIPSGSVIPANAFLFISSALPKRFVNIPKNLARLILKSKAYLYAVE